MTFCLSGCCIKDTDTRPQLCCNDVVISPRAAHPCNGLSSLHAPASRTDWGSEVWCVWCLPTLPADHQYTHQYSCSPDVPLRGYPSRLAEHSHCSIQVPSGLYKVPLVEARPCTTTSTLCYAEWSSNLARPALATCLSPDGQGQQWASNYRSPPAERRNRTSAVCRHSLGCNRTTTIIACREIWSYEFALGTALPTDMCCCSLALPPEHRHCLPTCKLLFVSIHPCYPIEWSWVYYVPTLTWRLRPAPSNRSSQTCSSLKPARPPLDLVQHSLPQTLRVGSSIVTPTLQYSLSLASGSSQVRVLQNRHQRLPGTIL